MASNSDYGSFVPTTNIYDIENLSQIKINSPEFIDFLVRVRQTINNMAVVLNTKDSGFYELTEFICGQIYFEDPTLNSTTAKSPVKRQVFRKVINFGALPNTGTTNVAHGITFPAVNTITFTRIYGTASDLTGTNYIPIPYASPTAANNVEISVDATNVSITTGSDRTAFTVTYVILEYIKE